MNKDEAINLAITLHTHFEKLKSVIDQKGKDLNKVISKAKSLELNKHTSHSEGMTPEKMFFLLFHYYIIIFYALKKKNIHNGRHPNDKTPPKLRFNCTYEVCWYFGEKTPHIGKHKTHNATCNHCHKQGHFEQAYKSKSKNTNKAISNITTMQHPNKSDDTILVCI